MSQLPKGWIEITIGDVLQPQSDGKLLHQGWSPKCHTEAADSDDWGVLKTTAIQDGFFLEEHNKKLPEDKQPRERIEVNAGDLLMTNAGPRARCGITTLVQDVRPKLMLSGKMYRMRFNQNYIYPRFIEACLRSEKVRAEIDARKTGMSESGLNLTQARFLTVPFRLAPLNEQIRIANKLDSILAKVDKAQARLDKIPAILKRFRQSVLAAATSGELTKEWRGEMGLEWEANCFTVEQIAKKEKYSLGIGPFGSNLKVADYRDEGHPLVFVREIRARQFGGAGTKFVDHNKFSELVAHRAKPGNILITKMGDPPGDVAMYSDDLPEAVITSDCIKLDVNEELASKQYVFFYMQSEHFQLQMRAITAGVAQQKVNLKNFKTLGLLMPSLEEQTQIISRIITLVASADKVEKQYLDAKARLDRLTQSILAKAFRGELVPQDPSDESAEKLLERILAEREQAKPKKATRKRTTKAKTAEKG
ncbi:restriction endonuclease subunit S [Vibrio sp. 10N.261.55.F4]|uniref:restriction endonuclease subunit S n=1 Tax=Vibrio sp. 10N.261.55.F4 TaxID=3229692 RepID=UPI00354C42E5